MDKSQSEYSDFWPKTLGFFAIVCAVSFLFFGNSPWLSSGTKEGNKISCHWIEVNAQDKELLYTPQFRELIRGNANPLSIITKCEKGSDRRRFSASGLYNFNPELANKVLFVRDRVSDLSNNYLSIVVWARSRVISTNFWMVIGAIAYVIYFAKMTEQQSERLNRAKEADQKKPYGDLKSIWQRLVESLPKPYLLLLILFAAFQSFAFNQKYEAAFYGFKMHNALKFAIESEVLNIHYDTKSGSLTSSSAQRKLNKLISSWNDEIKEIEEQFTSTYSKSYPSFVLPNLR